MSINKFQKLAQNLLNPNSKVYKYFPLNRYCLENPYVFSCNTFSNQLYFANPKENLKVSKLLQRFKFLIQTNVLYTPYFYSGHDNKQYLKYSKYFEMCKKSIQFVFCDFGNSLELLQCFQKFIVTYVDFDFSNYLKYFDKSKNFVILEYFDVNFLFVNNLKQLNTFRVNQILFFYLKYQEKLPYFNFQLENLNSVYQSFQNNFQDTIKFQIYCKKFNQKRNFPKGLKQIQYSLKNHLSYLDKIQISPYNLFDIYMASNGIFHSVISLVNVICSFQNFEDVFQKFIDRVGYFEDEEKLREVFKPIFQQKFKLAQNQGGILIQFFDYSIVFSQKFIYDDSSIHQRISFPFKFSPFSIKKKQELRSIYEFIKQYFK